MPIGSRWRNPVRLEKILPQTLSGLHTKWGVGGGQELAWGQGEGRLCVGLQLGPGSRRLHGRGVPKEDKSAARPGWGRAVSTRTAGRACWAHEDHRQPCSPRWSLRMCVGGAEAGGRLRLRILLPGPWTFYVEGARELVSVGEQGRAVSRFAF